jgi:high-affinity iron transporter
MAASLLLTFREGLEAALIVGIVLGYLNQIGHQDRRRWVWAAVGVAVAGSLALAIGLQAAGAHLEGTAEAVFEGFAMLLAAGLLTWMIVWLRTQARYIKQDLELEVRAATRQRRNWALFSVVFLAVFREGVETALFLTAADIVSDGPSVLVGSLAGLGLAVLTGWAIYTGTVQLNMRRFFDVTSVLLLIFAAGLLAHGIHEFQEAGWLPVMVEQVWNLKGVLDDSSTVGAILRTLVGYNDDPTLLEVIAYLGYWILILVPVRQWTDRQALRPTHAAES